MGGNGMSDRLTELRAACGYSDGADGSDESDVDSLIAYKDALEDAYVLDAAALDELNLMLSAPEWPGASGMEDVLEVVRRTGRVEIPDAPEWRGH
jgi:hypothetical protein